MFADLPIYDVLQDLRQSLRQHRCVILQAPPGAGKSTILPIELMGEEWLQGRKVLMLEPRRLAARGVAGRMAALVKEPVGEKVGFRVRFENRVGPRTQVEVVTEGILTRMIQSDNALEEVGLVIFDEFHERSLHADLALVLCRQVQEVLRDDLRILVMSATIDAAALSSQLGGAPVLTSTGRAFPIRHVYVQPDAERHISVNMARTISRAYRENEGDILAFLPGAGEINATLELLTEQLPAALTLPLYGDLAFKDQERAITPDPHGRRKVVLSTSIAETSLTIEGITVVVDSGLARVPRFDTRSGLTKLETVTVTRDAADQRAGRAGRLGPGVAYRLWAEGQQGHLQARRDPEILSADLAPLMLELAQWGVRDPLTLTWPSPPPQGAVRQAADLLRDLGAVQDGSITPRGKDMLRLPTHPRIAHLLLESQVWQLQSLAADVAALLEERDPLPRETGADLSLRVETLHRWRQRERVGAERGVLERVEKLSLAWRKLLHADVLNKMPDPYAVGSLIAAAYPERIARQMEAGRPAYKLSSGRRAVLPQHDALVHEKWLAVAHLDAGNHEGKIFLAAPVATEDLLDLAVEEEVVQWDAKEGTLVAQMQKHVSGLVLESKPLRNLPQERTVPVLLSAIRSEPSLLAWPEHFDQWQARILSLRSWRPQDGWPDVRTPALLERLEEWLAPALTHAKSRNDLQRIKLMDHLLALLPWPLPQQLDVLAPTHLTVPTGSQIRLEYQDDGAPPVLAVRLQEMFGQLETPTVNEGRNKVLMHLLSPAYRPVQVTQDLHNFWKNTYHEVRKDLRGRYPKHHWPEDPFTAEAVRGVKRRTGG